MARLIDIEYYTFISQVEIGRGRIPTEKYAIWANALNVEASEFIVQVLQYYEPLIYKHLFSGEAEEKKAVSSPDKGGISHDKYVALKSEIRELQRLLGKKTLENELLRERLTQRNIGLPRIVSAASSLSLAEADVADIRTDFEPRRQRSEESKG